MNYRAMLGISCLCGLLATQACNKYDHTVDATVVNQIDIGNHDFEVALKSDQDTYHARFAFIPGGSPSFASHGDAMVEIYFDELKKVLRPGARVKVQPEYFDANHIGIFDGNDYTNPRNRCPAIELLGKP